MHQELAVAPDTSEAHTLRLQVADEADRLYTQLRGNYAEALANLANSAPSTYRHPWYLEKTAPDLVTDLDALLDELRRENEGLPDHPDDPREHLEPVGYYAATGAGDDLAERFRLWFGRYAERRADPSRMNPQDGSDGASLAETVRWEVWELYLELMGSSLASQWILSAGVFHALRVVDTQLLDPDPSELREVQQGACDPPPSVQSELDLVYPFKKVVAFRWRPEVQSTNGNASDVSAEPVADEALDQAIEVACLDLAQEEPVPASEEPGPVPATPRFRVPALRFSKLVASLQGQFGCEVRDGKGSEVVVFRPGGHIFSFRHHKKDFEVSPVLVRRVLRRLGIDPIAWLNAVYSKGRADVRGARQTGSIGL